MASGQSVTWDSMDVQVMASDRKISECLCSFSHVCAPTVAHEPVQLLSTVTGNYVQEVPSDRAGEMARGLGRVDVLPEDLISVPSTHTVWLTAS